MKRAAFLAGVATIAAATIGGGQQQERRESDEACGTAHSDLLWELTPNARPMPPLGLERARADGCAPVTKGRAAADC